jgi:DNA-binding transcriptional regulator YiaG
MTGNQLTSILEITGLTQADCARLLRRDVRTVRRWQRGEVAIPHAVAVLLRVIRAGRVTADQLMTLAD